MGYKALENNRWMNKEVEKGIYLGANLNKTYPQTTKDVKWEGIFYLAMENELIVIILGIN